MTTAELKAVALEEQAQINLAYAAAMERVAAETGGRLGASNAPMLYAAHLASAQRKMAEAEALRREAQNGGGA
jgi:hypothetical protein